MTPSNQIDTWKAELVDCIHFLHSKGYAPATSSNYSFKLPNSTEIFISASGIDKGEFSTSDLMRIDLQGQPIKDSRKSSAETLLHTMIYQNQPEATCILHTHTVYNTVLSTTYRYSRNIRLEGFEVLKGLQGIATHDTFVDLPIFENSQDISTLAKEVEDYWQEHPEMLGFLLVGHGLYTWADSIKAAKRHVEVLEFLLECYYKIETFENR